MSIREFKVSVDESQIEDLHKRIDLIRWPDEINDEILCMHDPVKEKTGVFSESRTKICQDVINEQKKKVFDIYTDESDSPGEIC